MENPYVGISVKKKNTDSLSSEMLGNLFMDLKRKSSLL
jgi:hypothetical protein